MKTALILTGKFGSTNMSIANLMKNLIIPNNCDVFFYTFEDYYINVFSGINIMNHFKINDDDINHIKEIIGERLKSLVIEKTDKYDSEYDKMELSINEKLSFMKKYPDSTRMFFDNKNNKIKGFKRYVEQYFINNICFNILEEYETNNNIHYDAIIRLRSDVYFNEPFIMPIVNNSNSLAFIGDPLYEWVITSFFAGSRDAMKIVLQNGLNEMFIEPTNPTHLVNNEHLMHQVQYGCAMKQICIKNNIKPISIGLMANVVKLRKEGISIHMGPYHTNTIVLDDYNIQICKYVKDETTELRSYIFITPTFWINCNEETKYKEIVLAETVETVEVIDNDVLEMSNKVSSYRLGDLVVLLLAEDIQCEILEKYPESIASKYIIEKRKYYCKNKNIKENPIDYRKNNIDIITKIVLEETEKYKYKLPKDIEESAVIHLRLGDVVCGDQWFEKAKRPFSIEELEKSLGNVSEKKYVIGKCFFGSPSPSPNFEESIIASNKYLSEVLERINGEHFDGGNADIDLCCAVKCKLFIQGRGFFSKLIVLIRGKLGLANIECESVEEEVHIKIGVIGIK